jgi:hypothetical protein
VARHVKLTDLIPPDDERDTIEMLDGKVFFIPEVGVKEMGRLLGMEEELSTASTLGKLEETLDRVLNMLRAANPGKKVPDYDLSVPQLMEVIAVIAGAEGGATAAVREALSNPDKGEEPTDGKAAENAQQLAEAAGTADEENGAPLASAKRSRTRSSRSASSGTGGRSGGTRSAGQSSSRTSAKRKTSKTG